MLPNVSRRSAIRAFAVLTAMFLIIGLTSLASSPSRADETLQRVSGSIWSTSIQSEYSITTAYPDSYPIPDVSVRFYRATGDTDNPWALQSTTYSLGGTHGGASWQAGSIETMLPPGTYRAIFNEFDDGGRVWDAFLPHNWSEPAWKGGSPEFTVSDAEVALYDSRLPYRGGLISGRITDQCGAPVPRASVGAFETTGETIDHAAGAPPVVSTTGDWNGYYAIHALDGPTNLRFTHEYGQGTVDGAPAPGHETQWFNDAASFEEATPITVAPLVNSSDTNILMVRTLRTSGTTPIISGMVLGPQYGPQDRRISGLAVRLYRFIRGAENPWVLEKLVHTDISGEYGTTVPVGLYRITYNEFDDGGPVWDAWSPKFQGNATTFDTAPTFCLEGGANKQFPETRMNLRGGAISGRVTNARGVPLIEAVVQAYNADVAEGDPTPLPSLTTQTNENGEFTIYGVPGPTKLRIASSNNYVPEWFGDSATFAGATAIDSRIDAPSTGNDVVLADEAIKSASAPKVSGTVKIGATLSTNGGAWGPIPVQLSYQWLRTTGTTTRPIAGATSSRYSVKSFDYGKQLAVRVTASPLPDYPGVAKLTKDSARTAKVKLGSTVTISGKPTRTSIKLTMKVTMTGIAHPKGTLTVSWVNVQPTNYGYKYLHAVKTKKVSFTDGVAKTTVPISFGYWLYSARYGGSATVGSATSTSHLTHSAL